MRVRVVVALAAVLLGAVAVEASTAPAAAPSLSSRLTRALKGPYLPPGRTAAIAIDLETGTLLYAHNETKSVIPASNEKLAVAWTALVRLGPAYRFHTELYGVGSRVGATWEGDLVLKGYGDPTLATSDLAALARKLATLGIVAVHGRVRGDESFYDRERGVDGWKRGFLGIESPPLSGLVVDRGLGWPALSPPLLAAKALTAELRRAGVTVSGRPGLGRAPASATLLASDRSVRLAEVLRFMDHESDNFTAEMLLKQLAAATGVPGTTAGGAAVVTQAMRQADIPLDGVRIADGSGLSGDDRLTTAALAGILETAWRDPAIRVPFVRSLAVSGTSGTMRHRLPELKGAIVAKTGTTDLACSLSGFVRDRFAFVIVQNGSPVAYWTARQAQDRFVTLLAGEAT
jgi:D-alanyl-D-alanine carboxypeptidase/D-alanyl-D-alanine-endopeptidase (penicillin-binding protein 4)